MQFLQSGPPDSNGHFKFQVPISGGFLIKYIEGIYEVTIPTGVVLGGVHRHFIGLQLSDGSLLQHVLLKALYGQTGNGGLTPYVLNGQPVFVPFSQGTLEILPFASGFLTTPSTSYFVIGVESL